MKREDLHIRLDKALDDMGYEKEITLKWGSFLLQVNFENGKEVLTVRERETKK